MRDLEREICGVAQFGILSHKSLLPPSSSTLRTLFFSLDVHM